MNKKSIPIKPGELDIPGADIKYNNGLAFVKLPDTVSQDVYEVAHTSNNWWKVKNAEGFSTKERLEAKKDVERFFNKKLQPRLPGCG